MGGLQSRYGRTGEVKILYPTGTRNSDLSRVQPVDSYYTYCANPAHKEKEIKEKTRIVDERIIFYLPPRSVRNVK
jgi:hypothetical protein